MMGLPSGLLIGISSCLDLLFEAMVQAVPLTEKEMCVGNSRIMRIID